jgi:parallel beta-helix repeat protein
VDPITLLPLQCFNVVCDGGTPLPLDRMPPNTTITQGPGATTHFTSATFHFMGQDNQSRVHFQCRLDSSSEADFAPCTSPATLANLGLGMHVFEVRAVDFSGNVDPTPAAHAWTIEALPPGVPPVTTIDSGPDPMTVSTTAVFTFSANEPGATFECSLDGADFAECTSPAEYAGLGVGSHELRVRAVDVDGLADLVPASYQWTVAPPPVDAVVSCGQVITQSTRVLNDLFDCPANGLVIGADGITLDLDGHTLDGVGLGSGVLNPGFDSVTIVNGIAQEFDFGVQLSLGTTQNIVSGMTLNLSQEAAIQLSDNASSNIIRNNLVSGSEMGIALLNGVTNTLVRNNVVSGNPGEGLYLLNSNGNRIEANLVTASSGPGMLLEGSSSNTVIGNTFSTNSGGGISVGETELPSNDNRFEGNILSGNSDGITIVDSSGNELVQNRLDLNSSGITLDNAQSTLIQGNDLRGNSGGIELSESSNNRVEANNASGNNGSGIAIGGVSLNNVVLFNRADGNNGEGISIEDAVAAAQGNLIEQNSASSNGGDGIFAASGHTLTANFATFNDGWGIFAESGAIDGGGNIAAGNSEPQQCSGIVCTDGGVVVIGAPDTLIVERPPNPSNSRAALFTFTGTDDTTAIFDLGFECRLDSTDDLDWLECDNPQFYPVVSPGTHTFEVRAVDLTETVDPIPATYTWTYEPLPSGVAPDTVIDLAPPLSTPLLEGFFTFSSNEPDVTFECSLDGAAFEPCGFDAEFPVASGVFEFEFDEFQVGPHNFRARAIDFEGNVDPTPASYTWTVRGLITTITDGPAFEAPEEIGEPASGGETESTTATFEFHSNVADATFQCSLDLGQFTDCTSPATYTGLAVGEHLLRIIATDPEEELVQVEPTEYEWTVILSLDTTPPDTSITSAPPNLSSGTTFTFTGTDNVTQPLALTFECRLDSTSELDWFECASPFNLLDEFPELETGAHTLDVRALDEEDNVDPVPASYAWTRDTALLATAVSCGQVITWNALVTNDLVSCPGDGLVIGAAGITLDLGGHTIAGGGFGVGIRNEGFPGVTITNGAPAAASVQGFQVGVQLGSGTTGNAVSSLLVELNQVGILLFNTGDGSTGNSVLNNTASGNDLGIVLAGLTQGAVVAGNTVQGSADQGVRVENSSNNLIESNTVSGSIGSGIALQSGAIGNTLRLNVSIGNGQSGILVASQADAGSGNVLEGNTANQNTGDGILVLLGVHTLTANTADMNGGLGINVAEGNIDGGGNAASGNGDPMECSGIECIGAPVQAVIPPETVIASGPAATTTSTSAIFSFSSDVPDVSFECSLDGAEFTECANPATYAGLGVGSHSLSVRAVDPEGTVDPTPSTHAWTVVAPMPPFTVQASADAWIDQNSSTSNKGDDSILKVQAKGPRDNFRALVRFALPALPAGQVVQSATLHLYAASYKSNRTLQAYRIAGAWSESSVTWQNQPPTAGTAASTTSGNGWRQWNVTTQVQEMYQLNAGHGFLIRDASEGGNGSEQQFHAREKGETPPVLVITVGPAG